MFTTWGFEPNLRHIVARLPRPLRAGEWGAGTSTDILTRLCGEVFTVESHPEWAARCAAHFADRPSARVLAVPQPAQYDAGCEFVAALRPYAPFDLVMIDCGGYRIECCREAEARLLKPDGICLLHDFPWDGGPDGPATAPGYPSEVRHDEPASGLGPRDYYQGVRAFPYFAVVGPTDGNPLAVMGCEDRVRAAVDGLVIGLDRHDVDAAGGWGAAWTNRRGELETRLRGAAAR